MEIILENPSLLKKSMEVISDLVIEGTIVFKKDYLEFIALNSNNVVMVVFRLLSTNFKQYKITEDIKISLNLQHLTNILKSCDEKLELKLILEENTKLKIISGEREKNNKEFDLSLIEFSDENLQKVPQLDFPVKISLESSKFTKTISDLAFIEENIGFRAKKEEFSVEGKNNSMSGKIDYDKDSVSIGIVDEKDYFCKYSMEYLKKFIKCEKLTKDVELNFGNEYPLKVEYKLMNRLLISFILAPSGDE